MADLAVLRQQPGLFGAVASDATGWRVLDGTDVEHTFGLHPLLSLFDATGEALAGVLRPGNAGSNTAADHVTVLDQQRLSLMVLLLPYQVPRFASAGEL